MRRVAAVLATALLLLAARPVSWKEFCSKSPLDNTYAQDNTATPKVFGCGSDRNPYIWRF